MVRAWSGMRRAGGERPLEERDARRVTPLEERRGGQLHTKATRSSTRTYRPPHPPSHGFFSLQVEEQKSDQQVPSHSQHLQRVMKVTETE